MEAAGSAVPAAAARRKHFVGYALLLGRKYRVEGLFHPQELVHALRSLDHALALMLVPLDEAGTPAFGRAFIELSAPLLHALFHHACLPAEHARVGIPLRLLGSGDLQRRADVREPGFDPVGQPESAVLVRCIIARPAGAPAGSSVWA
jgi:hypothetical protein